MTGTTDLERRVPGAVPIITGGKIKMANYFTYQGKYYGYHRLDNVAGRPQVGDFLAVDMASSEEKDEATRIVTSPHVKGKLLALWTPVANGKVTPVGRLWCKVIPREA